MKNFFKTELKYLSIYLLLILNIIFWLAVAVNYSFVQFLHDNTPILLLIKTLLFIEPLLFFITLIGVIKKVRIIMMLSMPFLFINAVLSLTDEFGTLDFLAMMLNIITLLNLLYVLKTYDQRTTSTK